MRIYLLVAIVVALSAIASARQGAWKPRTEYRYKLHTKTLAAMPDNKNQYVGVMTKADVTIRPLSSDVLIGKVTNGAWADYHDEYSPDDTTRDFEKKLRFETFEDLNTKEFEIRLRKDVIHSIAVDKRMTNTQLNQLKGILSQLQVDLAAENVIKCSRNQLPDRSENNQAVYKVMEPTVTGKCETLYDISPLPEYIAQSYAEYNYTSSSRRMDEPFFEVTKTRNYSNCEQRLGYHFGISGANDWKPNTNSMGDLFKSAVSRVVASGTYDKYTIFSSRTTNRVVKIDQENDKEKQESMVISEVRLELVSMEESSKGNELKSNDLIDVGNLVFSYEKSSDKDNFVRTKTDSSEEDNRSTRFSSSSEEDYDMYDGAKLSKKSRKPRSLSNVDLDKSKKWRSERKNRRDSSSSSESSSDSDSSSESDSSSSDSVDSSEEFHLRKPSLKHAPEHPFYAYDIDRFYKEGKKDIVKLVEEITEDLRKPGDLAEKNTLAKFNVLVRIIRRLDATQIEETTRVFKEKYADDKSKAWKTYRDALVEAGTGPAIDEIMQLIERREIKDEEAAALIAAFPKTIREPTEEMQRRFLKFVKHENVRKEENVDVAAAFAFTRFLFQAQVNNKTSYNYYPVHSYGRLAKRTDEFVRDEVIPYFEEMLRKGVDEKDTKKTLHAIRALGNLGHRRILDVFEPYLEGKTVVTTFERLAMIVALDKYTVNYPKSARTLFFRIYQNQGDVPEIRAAAVFHLMRTNPPASLLQRLAEQTKDEPSSNVRAAVTSAIRSAAALKSPENWELVKNARAAQSLLKDEKYSAQSSRTFLHDYIDEAFNKVYQHQFSYIVSKDSFFPSNFFLTTEWETDGFKQHDEEQAMVSSIKRLIKTMKKQFYKTDSKSTEFSDEDDSKSSERKYESEWDAYRIASLLGMEKDLDERLQGQLMFTAMNAKRFFTFDKKTMRDMPNKVRELMKKLKSGHKFEFTKFYNKKRVEIVFPVETGLPFKFVYRKPALVQLEAEIQATARPEIESSSSSKLRMPDTVNIDAKFDAVYTSMKESTLGFVNPFNKKRYYAGYVKKYQVRMPVQLKSLIDLRRKEIATELKPIRTEVPEKLIHMSVRPFTAYEDITALRPLTETKNLKPIYKNNRKEEQKVYGQEETGFAFVVDVKHDRKYFDGMSWFMNKRSPLDFFEFDVTIDPKRSSSDKATFTMSYERNKNTWDSREYSDEKDSGEERSRRHPRSLANKDKYENFDKFDKSDESFEVRRKSYMNRMFAESIRPIVDVFDLKAKFEGKKTIRHALTFAAATHEKEDKFKFEFDYKKTTSDSGKPTFVKLTVDADSATLPELRTRESSKDPEPIANVDVTLSYGESKESSSDNRELKARITLKQTPEYKEYMRRYNEEKTFSRLNTLNMAKIQVDMKKLPEEHRRKIEVMYNWLRATAFPLPDEEDSSKYRKEEILIEAMYEPRFDAAKLTIATPTSQAKWIDMRISRPVGKLIVLPANLKLTRHFTRELVQYNDICLINESETKTFDNTTVKQSLGKTWHMAVHKTEFSPSTDKYTKKDHVSVLVRDADSKYGKEVLIIIRDADKPETKIHLLPKLDSDRLAVKLNDEIKPLKPTESWRIESSDTPKRLLARIIYTASKELLVKVYGGKTDLPGLSEKLEVIYNGERVKIRANDMWRKNKGFCGAYTGEQFVDMKSPRKEIVNDDREFIASWALTGENTSDETLRDLQKRTRENRYAKERVIYTDVITHNKYVPKKDKKRTEKDSRDNRNTIRRDGSDEEEFGTIHKNYVKSVDQKTCFSKRPLPACRNGYRANGETEREVDVYCIDPKSSAAKNYEDQISKENPLDLTKRETSRKLKFNLPRTCIKA